MLDPSQPTFLRVGVGRLRPLGYFSFVKNPKSGAGLRLFVSIWFQVLFHCPHRATFHLSLAVLVHYRSQMVFSLRSLVDLASPGTFIFRATQE